MPDFRSQRERHKAAYIGAAVGAIFAVYLGIVIAPVSHEGLIGILKQYDSLDFFHFQWTQDTPKAIAVCLVIYLSIAAVSLVSMKRYHRRGVEQGSADYADISKVRKEFYSSSEHRVVFTKHVAISTEQQHMYSHKRNLNSVEIGGPGSNKTRGFVYPNLIEANGSTVVFDPKGEAVRTMGKYLEDKGFKVKVLDLIHPERSWGYNPFRYIKNDDDVQRLVTAIFAATTQKGATSQDPFWDEAGKMLLSALMYLLYYFGLPEEQNFPYLMELLRAGKIEDADDDTKASALDLLFENVEQMYPDHICVRYYKNYHSGAGKTLQSVQVTLISRLQKFELASIAGAMREDEMDLDMIGDEHTALFLVIPDNDTSYNFIVSLLYIQLFQSLYDRADNFHKGRLPQFVHVIMDEFANVYTPDDFLSILGTCRSRNIGISIILQNLSQLKAKYKEGWENIMGQCDSVMFLGGNEQCSLEYFSKMLGKETIDTNSYGRQYGDHGHSSANYQISGRELLTMDEVRLLPYNYALLLIKHTPPIIDEKIDVMALQQAKQTPLYNRPELEFHYGLRQERIPKKLEKPKQPKQTAFDPYLQTVIPDHDSEELWKMDILVDGSLQPQAQIAQWIQAYDLESVELFHLENK